MTKEETQARLEAAIRPLEALSKFGFTTTICGAPLPGKLLGEGLSVAAIETLDIATKHPNVFIEYDAPATIELFRAGFLMAYVSGGDTYFEPTAVAKREGQGVVAAHRRGKEIRSLWLDFLVDKGVAATRDEAEAMDIDVAAGIYVRKHDPELSRRVDEMIAGLGYAAEPRL